MTYEVYKITCSVSGKIYIGRTGAGLKRRFAQHLKDAWRLRNTALGDAIRLYGEGAFAIETLWSGDTLDQANAEEMRLIAELGTLTPHGYNITPGGQGVRRSRRVYVKTGPRGPMSEETRNKIRQSCIGRRLSDETKAKLRAANLGKKASLATIELRRIAALGKKHSAETRAKMSRAQKGRVITPEAADKVRRALSGRKRNPEMTRRQKQTWALKRIARQAAMTYFGGFG